MSERNQNIVLPFCYPIPVAAHDTRRDAMDGPAKILNENSTVRYGRSPADMAVQPNYE